MILRIGLCVCFLITHCAVIMAEKSSSLEPKETTKNEERTEITTTSTMKAPATSLPETTTPTTVPMNTTTVPGDGPWWTDMGAMVIIGSVLIVVILTLVILFIACCVRRKRKREARASMVPDVRLDPKQQGDDVDSAKEAYRVSQDDTYLIVLPDEPVSAVGSTHSLGGPPSPENSQLYVNVPEGNHSSRPGSSHPVPPRPCEEVEGEMEYDYPNVRFGLPGHLNSKIIKDSLQPRQRPEETKEEKGPVNSLKPDPRRPPAPPSPHQDTYSPMYIERNEKMGIRFQDEEALKARSTPRSSTNSSPTGRHHKEDPLKKLAAVMNRGAPRVGAKNNNSGDIYQNSDIASTNQSRESRNQGLSVPKVPRDPYVDMSVNAGGLTNVCATEDNPDELYVNQESFQAQIGQSYS